MRAVVVFVVVLAMSSTALAGPQSTIGGKRLESDMVHNTGVGWPSLFYEWWNKGQGKLDWALGAELVYGDWSGAFSDVSVGFAVNAPLRWHILNRKHAKATTDVGIRFTPGAMVGGSDRGRVPPVGFRPDHRVMGGIRAELAVPVSIDVHDRVSVVTGGPAIGIGNGTSDVDFAFRIWVGTAFWSVLGK